MPGVKIRCAMPHVRELLQLTVALDCLDLIPLKNPTGARGSLFYSTDGRVALPPPIFYVPAIHCTEGDMIFFD